MKHYYIEAYNYGLNMGRDKWNLGRPYLIVLDSRETRQKYIDKYDLYRGNINTRRVEVTAAIAYSYHTVTVDGIRQFEPGTVKINHIDGNRYSVETTDNFGFTDYEEIDL